jgi:predicted HTH domain antitoxin
MASAYDDMSIGQLQKILRKRIEVLVYARENHERELESNIIMEINNISKLISSKGKK